MDYWLVLAGVPITLVAEEWIWVHSERLSMGLGVCGLKKNDFFDAKLKIQIVSP